MSQTAGRNWVSKKQFMKLCDELEQTIKQNQNYTQQLLQVAFREALEQGIKDY